MKTPKSLFLVLVAASILSCVDNKKEPEIETVDTTETETVVIPQDTETAFANEKIAAVFSEYSNVREGLVNSNPQKVAGASLDLMTAFANVGVPKEALSAAQLMSESDNIETQRTNFVAVTAAVENILSGAVSSGTVYKQFCPMAFDNKGAYWLSASKEIQNPYFGDKMLKCGRIDSEIK